MYLDGASAADVGVAFGISKQAVLASFHVHGYVLRGCMRRPNPALLVERIEAVLSRYDQGIPVAEIAAQLAISRNYAYELIREGGRSPERDRRARERKR